MEQTNNDEFSFVKEPEPMEQKKEEAKAEQMQNNKEYMHVKIAAAEVHKESRMVRNISLMGIGSTVLTAVFFNLNSWAGAGASGVFCLFFMFFIFKSIEKMKYLAKNYGL